MISDFVKGNKKWDYPVTILQGITLHRLIDSFTDSHEATREAKQVFRPHYRLYSGAIIDVVFDHFLATDETEFSDESLMTFSLSVYESLDQQQEWLPEKFRMMFPYMKQHNWLYHYSRRWGIEKSLQGLVHRSQYMPESKTAFRLFEQHYQLLGDCYRHFWAFAKPYAREQLEWLQRPGGHS